MTGLTWEIAGLSSFARRWWSVETMQVLGCSVVEVGVGSTKQLAELEPVMGANRDVGGRFAKGHAPIPGAHRPIGAPNLITRSLRERVLAGFGAEDGVTKFVKDLKENYPPAAAGLLARIIPPADESADGASGMITTVNILSIPVGTFLVGDPLRVATEEEARQLLGAEARLLIEHQSAKEEMIAAPVEFLEPEIILEPEPVVVVEPPIEADNGVLVIRARRRK